MQIYGGRLQTAMHPTLSIFLGFNLTDKVIPVYITPAVLVVDVLFKLNDTIFSHLVFQTGMTCTVFLFLSLLSKLHYWSP